MPGLVDALIDLVLPRRCVGCAVPGATLCEGCRPNGPPIHPRVDCGGIDVVAAARYSAGVRRAIIAYKERGRRDLAGVLGAMLTLALHELVSGLSDPPPSLLLVAPPSSKAVAAERGGDHVLRLARVAARRRGRGPPVRVRPGVLSSQRRVRDSAGLGVADRERNLSRSMVAVAPRGAARQTGVVIIDDIVTTGATLRETTRALRAAGWPVLGAAVVAATPRRLTADPLAGHGRRG